MSSSQAHQREGSPSPIPPGPIPRAALPQEAARASPCNQDPGRTAPAVQQQQTTETAWNAAISKARTQLGATDYARIIGTRTYDDCLRELTAENNAFSKRWPPLRRILGPCLEVLQAFDRAIATCCQSNPAVACLVWGGVQAVLTIASKSADCAQRIAVMLGDMTRSMPRFEEYSCFFPNHTRLQLRLVDVYEIFVLFCVRAFRFLKSKSFTVWMKVTWKSLDEEFANAIAQLRERARDIENEVTAANTEAAFAREAAAERRHKAVIDALPAAFEAARLLVPSELLPEDPSPDFLGREDELAAMRDYCVKTRAAGARRLKKMAIHGLGGMGKTQLALEFTFRMRSSFPFVFWIRSENYSVLQQDFGQISRVLGKDVAAVIDLSGSVQAAMDWLAGTDEPWLLVFDNVDDADAVLKHWPFAGNGVVIVTTRDREVAYRLADLRIELTGLRQGDAVALLNKIEPRISTSPVATSVVDELGRMPLALCQMGSYIRQTNCGLPEFLEALKEQSAELYSDADSVSSLQYADTLARCCDLSIGLVPDQGTHLLGVLAIFQTDNIQERLLTDWCKAVPRLQYLDSFLEWNKSVRTLARRGLVSRFVSPSGNNMIRMHRVIKRRVLQLLQCQSPELRGRAFEDATNLLDQAFPQRPLDGATMGKFWIDCALWMPHVLSLKEEFLRLRQPGDAAPDNYVELLVNCAYYMWERGSADALGVACHALDICSETARFEADPLRADILTVVAALRMVNFETRQDAASLFRQAVEVRQRYMATTLHPLPRHDYQQLANAYNNAGVGAMILGRYDDAMALFEKSLEIKNRLGTEETLPYDFAVSYYNIGRVYMALGMHPGALTKVQRALELAEGHNGVADFRSTQFRFTYADLLVATGSVTEGLEAHENTRRVRDKLMGTSNNDSAVSYYGLSCVYQKVGRLGDANRHIDLAIKVFRQIPGGEDRLARSYFRKFLILSEMQDSAGAAQSLTSARETRAKLVGASAVGMQNENETMEGYDALVCYYNK